MNNFFVHFDVALFDEFLQGGAVVFWVLLDEEMVEAGFSGLFWGVRKNSIAVDDTGHGRFAEFFAGNNHTEKCGGADRTRTDHLSNANAALYQMSYCPNRYIIAYFRRRV